METTISMRTVRANGIDINVAETSRRGPAAVLLHGWPHTWQLWRPVMARLARDHHVIAPDLRGLGGSAKPETGYDLHTLADDLAGDDGLLVALGVERAALVAGIDLGAPVAWMAAVRHPGRVERLAVMESLLGTLTGAEPFLAAASVVVGFHAVPGLPEAVLAGHTDTYIDWFLRAGTFDHEGPDPALRAAFLDAYRDPVALSRGFDHYRALPANGRLVAEAAARGPLTIPVLALGGNTVGDALHRQLQPITTDLRGALLPECGHIIPADAPGPLAEHLRELLTVPATLAS